MACEKQFQCFNLLQFQGLWNHIKYLSVDDALTASWQCSSISQTYMYRCTVIGTNNLNSLLSGAARPQDFTWPFFLYGLFFHHAWQTKQKRGYSSLGREILYLCTPANISDDLTILSELIRQNAKCIIEVT